ncbi:MAG TPA: hydroxymethylbilane synthase [Candidatus Acidoferrales bacterium]|nr:hydroxymethylbilane synthase [Candidatus Acidoferrales bacterium]
MKPLRIGSRGSKLALWQAEHIKDRLARECGIESSIVIIKTSGDNFQSAAVWQVSGAVGGKGIFIKEIEDALLERRVDIAVHSLKDVPTETPRGLWIPAITKREDPRDCLVSRGGDTIAKLPNGARVGTSSLRRQSQMRHFRPDLRVAELRGNVDTRIRKLEDGEFDAVLVAKAGLDRLGLTGKITEIISPEIMLPAVGQGALAIEARDSEPDIRKALEKLNDAETRLAVTAERALLDELEGGCQVPLGAWARCENSSLRLDACVLSADGAECLRRSRSVDGRNLSDAESLGRHVARELLDAGADRLLRLAGRSVGEG